MALRQLRIVKDTYAGYEVQVRTLLWPWWRQLGGVNTFSSVERAEEFAKNFKTGREVVKKL